MKDDIGCLTVTCGRMNGGAFYVLKTREEALTGLLWEKVGEEGEFGFVLVEFYLGKAAVLQGPVPTSQLSPWSPVLGVSDTPPVSPPVFAVPDRITAPGLEGLLVQPCPTHRAQ